MHSNLNLEDVSGGTIEHTGCQQENLLLKCQIEFETNSAIKVTPNTPSISFLIENIELLGQSGGRSTFIAIKYILATGDGFCVRSNFLE